MMLSSCFGWHPHLWFSALVTRDLLRKHHFSEGVTKFAGLAEAVVKISEFRCVNGQRVRGCGHQYN
jgi:hypothetical protein